MQLTVCYDDITQLTLRTVRMITYLSCSKVNLDCFEFTVTSKNLYTHTLDLTGSYTCWSFIDPKSIQYLLMELWL